jgi:hypothetical protein
VLDDGNKNGIITPEEDQKFGCRRPGLAGQAPKTPDAIRTELELSYAATDNPRQRLDIYLPKLAKTDKPLTGAKFTAPILRFFSDDQEVFCFSSCEKRRLLARAKRTACSHAPGHPRLLCSATRLMRYCGLANAMEATP